MLREDDFSERELDQSAVECEDCCEPASVNRFGSPLCESCADRANERAYEHSLSEHYGGSGACTESERTHVAHQAKREGR